jgi:hypothetical protein
VITPRTSTMLRDQTFDARAASLRNVEQGGAHGEVRLSIFSEISKYPTAGFFFMKNLLPGAFGKQCLIHLMRIKDYFYQKIKNIFWPCIFSQG